MKADETTWPNTVLPPYDPFRAVGFLGYRSECCFRAIAADNPVQLAECLDRDFIDEKSEMLLGGTVLEYCRKVAPKCYAMWTERLA